MKISPSLPLLSRLLSLFAFVFLVGCSKEPVEPDPPEPLADAAAIESPSAAVSSDAVADDSAVDAELDAMFSALEKGDGALGETFANLSEEHQQTLQTAMEKAVKDIDFGLLTSAIGANLGPVDSSSVKVLSAEEAKELGIDLEAIRKDPSGVTVQSKIISVSIVGGDNDDDPPGDAEATSPEQIEVIETQQVDDPAAAQRIQQLLEAGDSDALAGELTKLLQGSVDAASLQQLIGE